MATTLPAGGTEMYLQCVYSAARYDPAQFLCPCCIPSCPCHGQQMAVSYTSPAPYAIPDLPRAAQTVLALGLILLVAALLVHAAIFP